MEGGEMNHEIHEAHEKAETLADVLAEMRIFRCRDLSTRKLEVCNAIANYFADRIEAAAKREPPRVEARWTVGAEYEYAYCSNCGHAEWGAWDSTEEAKDGVTDFCNDVKFCPNCGAKMKGGAS